MVFFLQEGHTVFMVCASMSMVNHFISYDHSSLFEQDFPRSGRSVRAMHQQDNPGFVFNYPGS
ncbi:hypothetical protein EA086_25690 [Salmonella enterica]|nr:hypothetical protein [Salmonella enterica]